MNDKSKLPAAPPSGETFMDDVEAMTNEQLDAELRANGIDPDELNKKMLERIRAEKAAGRSGPMLDEAEKAFTKAVAKAAAPPVEEPCWRCKGSGQRSHEETFGSPDIWPCPECQPKSEVAPIDLVSQPPAIDSRPERQTAIGDWCIRAFGEQEALSLPQRGIRLLEEAAEAAQSVDVSLEMAHKILDYVWSRPKGELSQELGGVGVTILALADAACLSAETCEKTEVKRVLGKPVEHFSRRNQDKNDAGFLVASPASNPLSVAAEAEPMEQPVTCRCGCLIFVRENGTIVPHWNDPDINGDQQKCWMNDQQWCDCHLHEKTVCDICQLTPKPSEPSNPPLVTESEREKVLKAWPDAELLHYPDGACSISSHQSMNQEGHAHLGWGQVTASRDCYEADKQAWADAASKLPPSTDSFEEKCRPFSPPLGALEQERHEFKNFHKNLCERFGYIHDEKDWKRDQVSLEEYIYNELKVEWNDAIEAAAVRVTQPAEGLVYTRPLLIEEAATAIRALKRTI